MVMAAIDASARTLRQERNREAEEATLAWVAESEARSDVSPFGRVLELVGASDSGRGLDMSRFRGLMITLRCVCLSVLLACCGVV